MQIHIMEKIRAFRKERRMTQEQLAEVLGVTVGAVSKWESGQSTPDLALIVEMASFFETSVDVLLGYEWHKGTLGDSLEKIKALRNVKNFDEASVEVEQALQKYPNSFDLVFSSAVMYSLKGVEHRSKKAYQRALTLFERALELSPQNTDPHISTWTIRNYIANVYMGLDETEKALEQLKQNNADGLNNGDIGAILATRKGHTPDEALPYLSDALVDILSRLFRLTIAFSNAYIHNKDHDTAIEVLQWMDALISGLRMPGHITYLDKESVILQLGCAAAAAEQCDEMAVRAYLRLAKTAAKRFDSSPNYGFTGIKFFCGNRAMTAFDDFGTSALESIRTASVDNEKAAEMIHRIWEEVLQEPDDNQA